MTTFEQNDIYEATMNEAKQKWKEAVKNPSSTEKTSQLFDEYIETCMKWQEFSYKNKEEIQTEKLHIALKPSFVAFIDILGFKNRFIEDKESCIELLSEFSKYNGSFFDTTNATGKRRIRPATLCFSDNIGITASIDNSENTHSDNFANPLIALLNAISFFAQIALEKGFYIRGAIAYGEMFHQGNVIAGKPFMEAIDHEKKANYPRIILTPSTIAAIKTHHMYGWGDKTYKNLCLEHDKSDNALQFNWINFCKRYSESFTEEEIQSREMEAKNLLGKAITRLEKEIQKESDIAIQQKLYWLKQFLHTQSKSININQVQAIKI